MTCNGIYRAFHLWFIGLTLFHDEGNHLLPSKSYLVAVVFSELTTAYQEESQVGSSGSIFWLPLRMAEREVVQFD